LATDNDVFGQQLVTRKRGQAWRWLGFSAAACVIAGGIFLGATKSGRETMELVNDAVEIGGASSKPDLIFEHAGGDHVNILLIGRDTDWKPAKVYDPKTKTYRPYRKHDESVNARSDTMIVVSLDKSKNAIRMISLPRDAMVYIPENDSDTGVNKLNAAHSFGGPELLMKTLSDELGITIHRYAVIKFEGFKKLIDQVGGVTVNVDGALKRDRHGKLYRGHMKYDDNWGNLHIDLQPGPQRLDGQKAHDYVRFRMDIEGDPGRIRRQQQVMRALAKEIMQSSKWKIPGLVKEVRHQFETTLTDEEIGSAAGFARQIGDSSKIQPLTMFGTYGRKGSVVLNKPKNKKLLAAIFGKTFNSDIFLERSPFATRSAEIGASNYSTPGGQQVLREAGLLEPGEKPDNPDDLSRIQVRTEVALRSGRD
jgi:LCP family protein required for cell wall assembly